MWEVVEIAHIMDSNMGGGGMAYIMDRGGRWWDGLYNGQRWEVVGWPI